MACAASPRITALLEKWYGVHLMEIKGRCGFVTNCAVISSAEMRSGMTPGKWMLKTSAMEEGLEVRESKSADGMNRVEVNDLSVLGMAMNIMDPPGHMCR